MRSVCVYCGASPGANPAFEVAATEVGRLLAVSGRTLVFGGGRVGLMGAVANGALAAGGNVIGVIPQTLVEAEVAHRGLTELHIVDTMHQRKALMTERADGFVVCPGGLGTLEEAFEQLTAIQLGYHHKPIVFLDVDGFWPPLAAFLDHAVVAGALRAEVRSLFRTASSAADALDALAVW